MPRMNIGLYAGRPVSRSTSQRDAGHNEAVSSLLCEKLRGVRRGWPGGATSGQTSARMKVSCQYARKGAGAHDWTATVAESTTASGKFRELVLRYRPPGVSLCHFLISSNRVSKRLKIYF